MRENPPTLDYATPPEKEPDLPPFAKVKPPPNQHPSFLMAHLFSSYVVVTLACIGGDGSWALLPLAPVLLPLSVLCPGPPAKPDASTEKSD